MEINNLGDECGRDLIEDQVEGGFLHIPVLNGANDVWVMASFDSEMVKTLDECLLDGGLLSIPFDVNDLPVRAVSGTFAARTRPKPPP